MTTKQVSKGERNTNRVLSVIAWLCVAIALLVTGWFYLFSATHISTNNAQVRQFITPVSSKVSGFIEEVRFKENQLVKQGDTLVVIDNREYQNQLNMAEAHLHSTAQSVSTYETSASAKATDVAIIAANIDAANIEVSHTEKEYLRFKNLVAQDAATIQQFEGIEAKYKLALARRSALQRQLQAAQLNTATEKSKVAPIKSQVSQQKASLENAKLNLSYTYIRAPYDGWVGVKNIQVGQLIKEGQALVQVVSKEKWIVANFKETQLGEIDYNADVEIKVDAYPNAVLWGSIESLSPAAGSEFSLLKPDNASGNFVKIEQRFPVKIILKESIDTDKLRTGMNVTVAAQKIN